MTLDSPREGSWWSPTDPTRRLAGTLRHKSQYGYELELHGSPDDIRALGEVTIEGIPLLGEDRHGVAITVWYLPMNVFPGSQTMELPVERAMLGIHSAGTPQFKAAFFTFRNLTGWSGRLSALRPVIEPAGLMTGMSYERPLDVVAVIEGGSVLLGESAEHKSSLEGDTFRREVQMMVEPQDPITFNEMLKLYLRPLQHLMTFANDQGLALQGLTLRTPGQDQLVTPIFEPVLGPTNGDASTWRPLFRLPEAPGGFEVLLQKWFDLHARVEPLLDLLLLQKYVSHVPFAEQRLLMYAQAAEGLHQRLSHRFEQHSLDHGKYSLLMTELEDGVSDEESRRWARDRLRRNDRTFRQRLVDLIENAGPAVSEILRPTPAQWASRVRDARDKWTHWSIEAASATEGADIRGLAAELSVVLSSNILSELGFDGDHRDQVIRRSEDFRWAALLGGA